MYIAKNITKVGSWVPTPGEGAAGTFMQHFTFDLAYSGDTEGWVKPQGDHAVTGLTMQSTLRDVEVVIHGMVDMLVAQANGQQ